MRRGKNLLAAIILTCFLWSCFTFLVLLIEPEMVKNFLIPGSYLPFFIILEMALYFTLALLFGKRRSLLFSTAVILFLVLRLAGLGNWLNLILIIGITIAVDNYSNQTNKV